MPGLKYGQDLVFQQQVPCRSRRDDQNSDPWREPSATGEPDAGSVEPEREPKERSSTKRPVQPPDHRRICQACHVPLLQKRCGGSSLNPADDVEGFGRIAERLAE